MTTTYNTLTVSTADGVRLVTINRPDVRNALSAGVLDDLQDVMDRAEHDDDVAVLILTGAEDHFIPLKMHDMQVKALVNARSVTARVFTREDQAQNHCQVGNTGLALKVMADWVEQKGT